MARDEQSAETVNRGKEMSSPDAESPTFSVWERRWLPADVLQSVSLRYVRLGYRYLLSNGVYLATIPVILLVCGTEAGSLSSGELWRKVWDEATYDLAAVIAVLACSISLYIFSRPRPIYLIDFATYKPADELKVSKAEFICLARKSGKFDEESLSFQARLLARSGIGDESYMPQCVFQPADTTDCATMKEGRAEASVAMFAALDELFDKCRVRPRDVGVLVVNCSVFNPTPSLAAMIVNRYKMRSNILSYNLGGMGCSAGVISMDVARETLQASGGAGLAVVVSMEAVSFTWYAGKRRSMLIPNAFFRAGCAAVLLSSRRLDRRRAKYQLEHVVRTNTGADDRGFRAVYQEEDEQRIKGMSISRDLVEVSGHALKTHLTNLGPLVHPFSDQLLVFAGALFRSKKSTAAPYVPDLRSAFEHLCLHAASRDMLEHLQRDLELRDADLEASRATLHRFGNTSSSSIWYELAYLEAKGRVRRGDRVWQLACSSGFKCHSAVWRALGRVRRPSSSSWLDCVDQYPERMDA